MKTLKLSRYFLFIVFIFSTLSYAEYSRSFNSHIQDTAITASIKLKYSSDPLLYSFKLHVTTKNGLVYIIGRLNSDMQFERAIMIAESVEGVKNVDVKKLKVKKSDQPLEDTLITAKIKGELIKNKLLNIKQIKFWNIRIETKNGVVYVYGKVDNKNQLQNILDIVKSVKGVKRIRSYLELK